MKQGAAKQPASSTECVKVVVRCRPINKTETGRGCSQIVEMDNQENQVILKRPDSTEPPKSFTFDFVYGSNSTQQQVYDDCAFPLVESVLEGYNGTIFAYGQTGCGKSHTMMGNMGEDGSDDLKGVIPKAVRHVFGCIDGSKDGKKFLVRCSYLEIYNETILDLLGYIQNKQQGENLKIHEDPNKGIYVQDLTNVIVKTVPELEKLIVAGIKNRKVGETAMNKDSSRSHSIFTIFVETAEDGPDGQPKFKVGKLNLVDLAGSERQSKTQATGDRLKEAQKINLSLSALGNVISALVDGKSQHIPYRDSKLTRLLQDSLGGNTKTVMIAALSPADYNYDETLSTLRYAARAKCIQNKPKINEDPKDTLLRQYEDEIRQLREMLANMQKGGHLDQKMASKAITNHYQHQQSHGNKVEESVDELIRKLEGQGKKIKILSDEDDDEPPESGSKKSPKKKGGRKQSQGDLKQVEDQKAQIETQLKQKEELLQDEQQQKKHLESMLKEIEAKLVTGGNALEEKEREQAQKYREFQLKLKQQKKKEKKLMLDKKKKEEDLLLVEKSYKSLQEEVEEQRKVIEMLRTKYKQASSEVKDIEHEHQIQKEQLLDAIRDQDLDLKFFKKITKMLLKDEEIAKLRLKSAYEDDDWVVPPFLLKAKEVSLPKVNGRAMMDRDKEQRELEIGGEIDGGRSRSTGDSDSDSGEQKAQAYKKQISKTANDGGFQQSHKEKSMPAKGKSGRDQNPSTSNLRKSIVDMPFGFEKDAPLVKNNKINAQLMPIENIYSTTTGQLPPPMSRDELMKYEKNHKNVSIESLLGSDSLQKGKHQLAPLARKKF